MFLTFIRSELSFIMFKMTKMFYKTTSSIVASVFSYNIHKYRIVLHSKSNAYNYSILTITTSESSKEKSRLFNERFERFSDFNKCEE